MYNYFIMRNSEIFEQFNRIMNRDLLLLMYAML